MFEVKHIGAPEANNNIKSCGKVENKKTNEKKESQELRQNENNMKEPSPSYYSIIPADVRYDSRLSPLAKLLYSEITCLCQKEGYCWATNAYFAKLYKKSKVWISNTINLLAKCGYIHIHLKYIEGTKQIETRFILLRNVSYKAVVSPVKENFHTPMEENFNTPIKENFNTPIKENFKGNNTSINTINYLSKKVRKTENIEENFNTPMEKNLHTSIKENCEKVRVKKNSKLKKPKKEPKKDKADSISFNELIDNFTSSEELRRELREHLKTRKLKKASVTNRAIELSLKKLNSIASSVSEMILIVQNSIMNGWTTFYPLKADEKKQLNDKTSYNLSDYEKTMDTIDEYDGFYGTVIT